MRPTALFISNIRWDFVWQRHQTLASLFAQDYEVIFCEIPGVRRPRWRDGARLWQRLKGRREGGTRAEPPPRGVRVVKPPVFPAVYASLCRLNRGRLERWLATEPALRAGVDLIVNYSAARTARQLIERVPRRQLVYDCTDDWLAVEGVPPFLADDEAWLLEQADLTLVPSRTLLARKKPLARRCVQLPHGALIERFRLPARSRRASTELTLLYYGHIHRQHLDFVVLDRIARERPTWRLILVGPVKTPHRFPANVTLIGQVAHPTLRENIAQADVLLLPYVLNRYTEAVMPAKTYECLATGLPIVATPLPELEAALPDMLHYCRREEAWVPAIERAVRDDTPERQAQRTELAAANTWDSRYRATRTLLESNA